MLWTVLVILIALWLIGLVAEVGAWIHLLLAAAFVVVLITLFQSRRTTL